MSARKRALGPAIAAVLAVGAAPTAFAADSGDDRAAAGAKVVLRTADENTGAALPGARFELWRETNDQAWLQTSGQHPDEKTDGACVTDAKGTCAIELPVGETYYWRQTAAPAGYEPPRDPVAAFPLEDGHIAQGVVLTFQNQKKGQQGRGSIRILTKDAKTKQALRGAVFEVWKETNNTKGLQTRGVNADLRAKRGCATDRAGVCDFDRLSDGWYYLVETDVSEGYVVPDNRVTGPLRLDAKTPGRRLAVTLHNKRDKS
ncbi:MSCRAMM family protein [Streptomyces sp. NPDC003042]